MAKLLTGKVAIVTGGASGIGRGTVEAFIAEDAKVVIADIQEEPGEELARALGSAATYVRTDVRDEEQIAAVVAAAVDSFGRLDIMFNNAGHAGDPSPISEVTTEGFLETIRLLAASVLVGHKYAVRQFREQASGGSIISTSSIGALQGGFSPVGYVAAKAAILGIVRQATFEFGAEGIRSNAIIPGAIATPIIPAAFGVAPEHADEFVAHISERLKVLQPVGRIGVPSDVAGAALYLASDLSSFVSGTALLVDGGATNVHMGGTTEIAIGERTIPTNIAPTARLTIEAATEFAQRTQD
jgi:NAD(P)-dependent dehydrogenase (short-subunit alcohol dehydrogenase family)